MFGFLRPSCQTTAYRQSYARCCQYQRHHYGLLSLPLLSYEATLLYVLAGDCGAIPRPAADSPTCCRLRSKTGLARTPDAPLGEFCASLGLLLGAIKLEDDERDGFSLLAKAGNWLLRPRFAATFAYFQTLDRGFETAVRQVIDEHLRFEAAASPMPIEEYARPTGEAFGYAFGLLSKLDGMSQHQTTLAALGQYVGRAIIAFDCAVDWPRDRRRGDFNPLSDQAAIDESLCYCAAQLREASHVCRFAFGNRAHCVSILDSVRRRVVSRAAGKPKTCASLSPRRRIAQPGHVYTLMDLGMLGVIDACCEAGVCCEAAGAGGEAACADCCVVGGHVCPCEIPCIVCGESCSDSADSKQKASGEKAPDDAIAIMPGVQVGDVGLTQSMLRPMGKAVIDGQVIDVTSEGDFVDVGKKVEVVETGQRTVVRPID